MIQAKPPEDVDTASTAIPSEMAQYPVLFSLLNPLEELRPISLHLLNPKSKLLFFDDYYHKVAVKLQSNAARKAASPPKTASTFNRV